MRDSGLAAAASFTGFPAFISRLGERPFRIGYLSAMTGYYSSFSLDERRGIELALEVWNKRGGVNRRKVELRTADDEGDPGRTFELARRLVEKDGCVALCGAASSATALAGSGEAAVLRTLFFDLGGEADAISGPNCRWNTFQTCHTETMRVRALSLAFSKMGVKRVALITPDTDFGYRQAAAYGEDLAQAGGKVLVNKVIPRDTTDFSAYQLDTIDRARPDGIVVLMRGQDAINVVQQLKGVGLHEQYPVAIADLGGKVAREVPGPAYGVYEWYYKSDLVFTRSNKLATDFVNTYRNRYKTPPYAEACRAYVAVDRICWALDTTKRPDGERLASAIAGARFESLWDGSPYYRRVDHALMWPMWFAKKASDGYPTGSEDSFKIIERLDPLEIAPSRAQQDRLCQFKWPA